MSIHVIATKNGENLKIERQGTILVGLVDKHLDKQFRNAVKTVDTMAGNCDYFLKYGYLNLRESARALELAIGPIPYQPEYSLSAKEVAQCHKNAHWGWEPQLRDNKIAWHSAKEFLRVCAENDLGIRIEQ